MVRLPSHHAGEPISMVGNIGTVWKESQHENPSHLRLIKPGNDTSQYFRRSLSADNLSKKALKALQKLPNQWNNTNYYMERRLLNYLSPRLNHPSSRLTNAVPIFSKENTSGKNFVSCTIWIHLQVK